MKVVNDILWHIDKAGKVNAMVRNVHWIRFNNFIIQEIEVTGLFEAFVDKDNSSSFLINIPRQHITNPRYKTIVGSNAILWLLCLILATNDRGILLSRIPPPMTVPPP